MRHWLLIISFLVLTLGAIAASAEPATPSTATADTTGTATGAAGNPAPATHLLQGIRVRPQAGSLRLIFLFDRPVPYSVREDLSRQRVELEILNARLDYLPPELSHIADPRLDGIWIKRLAPGLVTLELRLPSTAMRLEHFTLDDPAAIVIDLYRTDSTTAQVVTSPDLAVKTTHPSDAGQAASTETATTASAPAPTPAAASAIKGAHGSVLPGRLDDGTPAPSNQSDQSTPPTPPPAVPVTVAPHSASTTETAVVNTHPSIHDLASSTTELNQQAGPQDADYDGFPVHAIQVSSPLAKDIFNDFLARRTSSVLEKGVQYLKLNRINEETRSILYLLAEARWKTGNQMKNPPVRDMAAFYQQALRVSDAGDLGAFGYWRLSQLSERTQDRDAMLDYLSKAQKTTNQDLRKKIVLLKIPVLTDLGRNPEALQLAATIEPNLKKPEELVELYVHEAGARQATGDNAGAWAAYQKANALDANWISIDMEGCENMARAALATGNLPQARSYIEYINNNFSYRGDAQKFKLALLYADVLARQGDLKTAENTYAELLINIGDKPKGAAVQRLMMELHPKNMIEGEGRYCELLWRQGKIREAMKELDRAWQQCLREGIATAPLEPMVEEILPLFMDNAVKRGQPYDALQAWKLYGFAVKSDAARRRTLIPRIDALAKLGDEADTLQLIDQFKQDSAATQDAAWPRLSLLEARLRYQAGEYGAAIATLEQLLGRSRDPRLSCQAYELLAQSYQAGHQTIEAAQAWQALAASPEAEPATAGRAMAQAGELFLGQNMPMQTVELGLKGLVYEKQLGEDQRNPAIWPPATANTLRLLLARAYHAQADYTREGIILKDLLTRPGLAPEEKKQASLMFGRSRLLLGQPADADETYQGLTGDPNKPDLYDKTATQTRAILDWNKQHPEWAIDLGGIADPGGSIDSGAADAKK